MKLCCSNNSHADLSNVHYKAPVLIGIKKLLSTTDDIVPQKCGRKRFKDKAIELTVKFILSEDHVQSLSWGSMDKIISLTESIDLSKLQRLTTRKMMQESYKRILQNQPKQEQTVLCQISFHVLCKELTS